MSDETDVDLHEVLCSDCGQPMDEHPCGTGSGGGKVATVTVPVRTTGPRKKAADHPTCPHCGGRIHWNNGASMVNFDCMYRQYLMDQGLILDPSGRLPVFTASMAKDYGFWCDTKDKAGGFEYGNMSKSGGAATYSAARPKATPSSDEEKASRKAEAAEKRKSARASKSITEVAAEVAPVTPAAEESELDALEGADFGDDEVAAAAEVEDDLETPMPASKARKARVKKQEAAVSTVKAERPSDLKAAREQRRAQRQARLKAMQTR